MRNIVTLHKSQMGKTNQAVKLQESQVQVLVDNGCKYWVSTTYLAQPQKWLVQCLITPERSREEVFGAAVSLTEYKAKRLLNNRLQARLRCPSKDSKKLAQRRKFLVTQLLSPWTCGQGLNNVRRSRNLFRDAIFR